MDLLKTEAYDYHLPENLIGQFPVEPRDSARMLVYNRTTKSIEHKIFSDIVDYLQAGDVLIINNTRVIPARLMGLKKETHASIEVLLLKRLNYTDWEVLMKPGKRAKIGTIIEFDESLKCEVLSDTEFGGKIVRFIFDGVFENILDKLGSMPLPPYIKNAPKGIKEEYNTVYAKFDGSAAAPTAGLHWTEELMNKARSKGVIFAPIILDVGLGTFRPVKVDDITQHNMHSERYQISDSTAQIINDALREGRRVIATGTTSLRTLEGCYAKYGQIKSVTDTTNIFIYPPFHFNVISGLITNFHLPKSTLLMLVSAFIGREKTLELYELAKSKNFRFYSFGDCMFLL